MTTTDIITKEQLRERFNDFRYLNSTDEPHIIREFVRYDDVVNLLDDFYFVPKTNNAAN